MTPHGVCIHAVEPRSFVACMYCERHSVGGCEKAFGPDVVRHTTAPAHPRDLLYFACTACRVKNQFTVCDCGQITRAPEIRKVTCITCQLPMRVYCNICSHTMPLLAVECTECTEREDARRSARDVIAGRAVSKKM